MPTGPVSALETLTRFIYEDSYFRRSDGTVKPKAFYPDSDGNCSVMVTTSLDHDATKGVAAQHVIPHRNGKNLQGYANVQCLHALNAELRVEFAEPPPNHAQVCGYPPDREQTMSRAQLLAKEAVFRRA